MLQTASFNAQSNQAQGKQTEQPGAGAGVPGEQQAKVTAEAAGRTSSQAEATRRTTASKGRPTAATTTAPTY